MQLIPIVLEKVKNASMIISKALSANLIGSGRSGESSKINLYKRIAPKGLGKYIQVKPCIPT